MTAKAFRLEDLIGQGYPQGFSTPLDSDTLRCGLDESVVRHISAKKNEPDFLLE